MCQIYTIVCFFVVKYFQTQKTYENILREYNFTAKISLHAHMCTHMHLHTHKTEMRAVRTMIISKQTKKGRKRERKIARARALLKVSTCFCSEHLQCKKDWYTCTTVQDALCTQDYSHPRMYSQDKGIQVVGLICIVG